MDDELIKEFEEEMNISDTTIEQYVKWLENNLIHERLMRDMDAIPDLW